MRGSARPNTTNRIVLALYVKEKIAGDAETPTPTTSPLNALRRSLDGAIGGRISLINCNISLISVILLRIGQRQFGLVF